MNERRGVLEDGNVVAPLPKAITVGHGHCDSLR